MPKPNIFLRDSTGKQIPLFREEYDGHPFALNRDQIVRIIERDRRLRKGASHPWLKLYEQGSLSCIADYACLLHEQALATGDMHTIHFTWRQLRYVLAWQTSHRGGLVERRIATLRQHRASGKKGGGAKSARVKNWDAICAHYDRLMADGRPRHRVTAWLVRQYDINKDVLARGLRARGRRRRVAHQVVGGSKRGPWESGMRSVTRICRDRMCAMG
jgi:hypothetical protein